ncbi:glycosyltransferase family 2 protein [Oceanobacillus luteolus]|uniref:glycosyltransferase family 2 protein n=1 Tax=Oceanobacillus luteolus TaxID=1274358 RepID=UPI00203F6427|nr:glycosyltransferase [Oceanobacillus luteolus]
MPRVSVIMGVMNAASRLDESIESIINQTFSDWEFIICDDGSTDHTYERLLEWSKRDSRIVPIKNNDNLGLAATLNHCIEYCTGEYIARMDDDDISYANRFEKQVNFLDTNPDYAFVSCKTDIFDGVNLYKSKVRLIEEPTKQDLLWQSRFIHPATMFRLDALKRVDGYRVARETIKSQDYDLFMRLYASGLKGYNIQEPLFRYYINPVIKKKKTKYKYRVNEAIIRYKGFKKLGFPIRGVPYIFKPLILGLIPVRLIDRFKKNRK